jgi:phosphoglycerate dehydrogenase-like enzyme
LRVAVLYPLGDAQKAELAAAAGDRCRISFFGDSGELSPVIRDMDVIMGNPPPGQLREAASLKWLQAAGAGVESYAGALARREGAVLTNASGAYGPVISEYMLTYALMLLKHMPQYLRAQDRREWDFRGASRSLGDCSAAVVGLGDLGSSFAKRLSALGAAVVGVKNTKAPKPDYLKALYGSDRLDAALRGADIVALCLPSTPHTRGIMSRERLRAMKPGAILLNVGRGDAIDQAALIEALREKRIYAGLDVTTPEPLPKVHPLWELENLVLTPHVTGDRGESEYTRAYIGSLFARNLAAFLDGRPLENAVDIGRGY